MKFYVWGVGESQFEAIRDGQSSPDATQAAWAQAQVPGRERWDPREQSSWAVEVDVDNERDIINLSQLDAAIRGWLASPS